MIISPPFLTGEIEESSILDKGLTAVAARETTTMAPEGNYPVSQSLMWHTGMHLQAPLNNGTDYAPVRAIADGKIIFVNPPRSRVDDKKDGQAYNPFGTEASWTDNGMVIIEHDTEIGVDGDVATQVKYYSSYMHLSEIAEGIAAEKKIYRKNILGKSGVIYDHPGQIELSICCDKDNLKKLIGRAPAWQDPNLTPTEDGRRDVVFGDIYIYLPGNTPISTTTPIKHLRDAVSIPSAASTTTAVPTATAAPSTTGAESTETVPVAAVAPTPAAANILNTAQWIKINFGNDGATPGACVLTTYNVVGEKIAACGPEIDFEYNLYKEANTRHESVAVDRTVKSSPSGWYELLRYGRNIGRSEADKDALPGNAAHWRKIKTVDGREVWADLNAEGTHKFSDADFLPIMNWNCFDDDVKAGDQRCDSPKLKELLVDPQDPDSKSDNDKLARRIGNDSVLPKLVRAICQFPNEWDKDTLDERYKFMSERPDIAENPGSWEEAKKHLQAMGISGLPAEFKAAQWHFHPAQFVMQFRKCGWLSGKEIAQCLPRRNKHLRGTTFQEQTVASWNTAIARTEVWRAALNRTLRKYRISTSKQRILHFLSQSVEESGYLRLVKEGGGENARYAPYYGRGLIQLTFPGNYKKYGVYRQFEVTNPSNDAQFSEIGWSPNDLIANTDSDFNVFNCADSAGFYWTNPLLTATHENGLKVSDTGLAISNVIKVSKLVNGDVSPENINGLDVRLQLSVFLKYVLMDSVPLNSNPEDISFTWRRNSSQEPVLDAQGHPVLNAQGHPKKKFYPTNHTLGVLLEWQRP